MTTDRVYFSHKNQMPNTVNTKKFRQSVTRIDAYTAHFQLFSKFWIGVPVGVEFTDARGTCV